MWLQLKRYINAFQGRLRYGIIGDYPAPSFFRIKEDDGQITVSNDLKTDNLKSTEYNVSILFIIRCTYVKTLGCKL